MGLLCHVKSNGQSLYYVWVLQICLGGEGVSSHAMPSPVVNDSIMSRLSKYVSTGVSCYDMPSPMVSVGLKSGISSYIPVGVSYYGTPVLMVNVCLKCSISEYVLRRG